MKETLCILVGLRYLVAKELGILPKSRSRHHLAAIWYRPVLRMVWSALCLVICCFVSSNQIFWKWQWTGGKCSNESCRYQPEHPLFPMSVQASMVFMILQASLGQGSLKSLVTAQIPLHIWKWKNSRLVCLDVSHSSE